MSRVQTVAASYVVAWWQKIVAVVLLLVLFGMIWGASHWDAHHVPGWPRVQPRRVDHLNALPGQGFDWREIEPHQVTSARWDSSNTRAISPIPRATKQNPTRLSSSNITQQWSKQAGDDLAELVRCPNLTSLELNGFLDPRELGAITTLSSLQNLHTADLFFASERTSPKTNRYKLRKDGTLVHWPFLRPDEEVKENEQAQMAAFVEIVLALPNLKTWAVSDRARDLLTPEQKLALADHPSLTTILIGHGNQLEQHKTLFPNQTVRPAWISAPRVGWAITVVVVGVLTGTYVLWLVATALMWTACPLWPGYAAAHRTAALGWWGLITAALAFVLFAIDVAWLPAVLTSALGTALALGMLELDRKSPQPGLIVIPICIVPSFMGVFAGFDQYGHRFLWMDEFLIGQRPDVVTMAVMLIVGLLILFWRAVPVYARTLTDNGRSAVIGQDKATAAKMFDRMSKNKRARRFGFAVSDALRDNHLASPATPSGRAQLILDGLPRPMWAVIFAMPIFFGLFWYVFLNFVSSARSNEPAVFEATRVATFFTIAMVWMFFLQRWMFHAKLVAHEPATLLPRREYVAALRTAVRRSFYLPLVITVVVGGLAFLLFDFPTRTILLAGVGLAMSFACLVSALPLAMTCHNKWLLWLVVGVGSYASFLCLMMAVMMSSQNDTPPAVSLWLTGIAGVLCGGIAFWSWRRMPNYQFGLLK